MKTSVVVMGMGLFAVTMLSSCKSSESAYKKAYEKAKQQELAEPQQQEAVVEETVPVVAPTEPKVVESAPVQVREEKVTVVSGTEDTLKDYSVVCGSFGIKANAENLKKFLDEEGYHAIIVYNADANTYRVVVSTHDDRTSAASARDAFKAKYPTRDDFQKSWLLYRIN